MRTKGPSVGEGDRRSGKPRQTRVHSPPLILNREPAHTHRQNETKSDTEPPVLNHRRDVRGHHLRPLAFLDGTAYLVVSAAEQGPALRLDARTDLHLAVARVGHIERAHQLVHVAPLEQHFSRHLLVASTDVEGVLGRHGAQCGQGRSVGTQLLTQWVVVHTAGHRRGTLSEHRIEGRDGLVGRSADGRVHIDGVYLALVLTW